MALMVVARYNFIFTRPRCEESNNFRPKLFKIFSYPGFSALPSLVPCSEVSCSASSCSSVTSPPESGSVFSSSTSTTCSAALSGNSSSSSWRGDVKKFSKIRQIFFFYSLHFSLMNAICSFIGIYFNAKNRPHITLTKEEAKVQCRS